MKLYYHPVSTTSRPVLLLAADEGIALDHTDRKFNRMRPSIAP